MLFKNKERNTDCLQNPVKENQISSNYGSLDCLNKENEGIGSHFLDAIAINLKDKHKNFNDIMINFRNPVYQMPAQSISIGDIQLTSPSDDNQLISGTTRLENQQNYNQNP